MPVIPELKGCKVRKYTNGNKGDYVINLGAHGIACCVTHLYVPNFKQHSKYLVFRRAALVDEPECSCFTVSVEDW